MHLKMLRNSNYWRGKIYNTLSAPSEENQINEAVISRSVFFYGLLS